MGVIVILLIVFLGWIYKLSISDDRVENVCLIDEVGHYTQTGFFIPSCPNDMQDEWKSQMEEQNKQEQEREQERENQPYQEYMLNQQ